VIRVLIVEDSPVVREFLIHILSADPDIRIAGTAHDGEEALLAVERRRPDVITMDIEMPRLNGLEATRQIMETHPTPIVIVSGSSNREVDSTFRAMEAGAVAFLRRPAGIGHPDHDVTARELVQTVKLMSEVKVVRRWSRNREMPIPRREPAVHHSREKPEIVALGASTGGPPVLQTILSGLPRDFTVPLVVVQHMAAGFSDGFVDWLAQSAELPVVLATQHEMTRPGHVYVAPDDVQMKITREGRVLLTTDGDENGLRPSVSYLFRSLAETHGARVVAGLLTGMGRDGAEELRLLKDRGAVTFAQDEETSVVHGMPGAAIGLGAATYILKPDAIAPVLVGLTNGKKRG
jgi:two-component system chemotaxis response regulator CheB